MLVGNLQMPVCCSLCEHVWLQRLPAILFRLLAPTHLLLLLLPAPTRPPFVPRSIDSQKEWERQSSRALEGNHGPATTTTAAALLRQLSPARTASPSNTQALLRS